MMKYLEVLVFAFQENRLFLKHACYSHLLVADQCEAKQQSVPFSYGLYAFSDDMGLPVGFDSDLTKAFCTLCCWEFSIGRGGERDLTQQISTEMHEKATRAKGASNSGK